MKTLHDADAILLALLQATDEAEGQKLQEELLLEHAAPIIRQTLRLRLQGELGSLQARGLDADDLFNEVYLKLMERLREMRLQPEARIRNFLVYVARVTTNVCHDVLRAKKTKSPFAETQIAQSMQSPSKPRNLARRVPCLSLRVGRVESASHSAPAFRSRTGRLDRAIENRNLCASKPCHFAAFQARL
ncbi:MAG TPA: sigma factor [Blastocatellia bacterium]|nr:sigma factor [Blastocatellia bacterium]HMZ17537.1 sigma factor [Blastocatellia bacterium]